MDEQNPRVTAERLSGRGMDETIGLETSARERLGTSGSSRRTVGVPPAPPANADYESPAMAPEVEQRTREIRADIEQTREEMSETVTAIQDRLRPSTIASNAVESMKSAATEAASEVGESEPVRYVAANPIPSAMIGIGVVGLAWLALRRRDEGMSSGSQAYGRRRYPQQAALRRMPSEQSASTGYAQSGYAESIPLSERTYGETSSRPRQGRMRTQNHLTRTWNETPLLVGAAAVVAGAIVGLSIPETEREHQLMGETRDRLLETAQRTVHDKVAQVQEAATDAVDRVQEVAKDVAGLTAPKG